MGLGHGEPPEAGTRDGGPRHGQAERPAWPGVRGASWRQRTRPAGRWARYSYGWTVDTATTTGRLIRLNRYAAQTRHCARPLLTRGPAHRGPAGSADETGQYV